jgi:predicted ArsR family transcriptional regulator
MRGLLAALKTAGATQETPATQTAAYAAGRKLFANGHEIAAALAALVVDGALTTRTDTVANVTEIKYWTTTPFTQQQEPTMAAFPDKIIKALTQHGPLSRAALAEKSGANAGSMETVCKKLTADGQITTRVGYDPETGRQAKHWMTPAQAVEWDARATQGTAPDSVAPAASPASTKDAEPAHLLRKIADLEAEIAHLTIASKADRAELSAAMANEKAERDRATGMEVDLAEICCALHVTNAGDALARIAEWKIPAPPVTAELVSTPDRGRLAMLLRDGDEADLVYMEPYVTEAEAQTHAINAVNTGAAESAYLIRALYVARREIRHGPIETPEIATLYA